MEALVPNAEGPSVQLQRQPPPKDSPATRELSLAAARYFAQLGDMRQRMEKYASDDGSLTKTGALCLAGELGIQLFDEDDAQAAFADMDADQNGTIDPMEFEAWFKRQVLEVRPTPVEEQQQLAAQVAEGLSSGQFKRDVQRETAKVARAAAGAGAGKPKDGSTPSKATPKAKPQPQTAAKTPVGDTAYKVPGGEQAIDRVKVKRPANAYGTNAVAWKAFIKLDEDGSGTLDRKELGQLVTALNIRMSSKSLARHFAKMDVMETGEISFDQFCVFFNAIKAKERRKLVRKMKELYAKVDDKKSGFVRKEQFWEMIVRSNVDFDPPFSIEDDWGDCKTTRTGEFPDFSYELTYNNFESWFKERLGIDDPDIPVLPEFMVQKIEEAAFFGQPREKWTGQTRSASQLWGSLRPRLLALVRMQRQWGSIHDIYEGNSASKFEFSEIPKGIHDPDSSFSAFWDLAQVVLLLYVSVTVPLRAGFELRVNLWTFAFFWDLMIDLYFIADILLNFRTAYYTRAGIREERPRKIALNYIRGWFFVDFFSSLPLSYLSYLGGDEGTGVVLDGSMALGGKGGGAGDNSRALKALRLVRLSKMLRLARIKKLMQRYSENVHLRTLMSIGFTIFLILFLVHIMACFFFLIGTADENLEMSDGTAVIVQGWVNKEDNWEPAVSGEATVPGTAGRYLKSMYYVLNALENSGTDGEMAFALFAELMRDFILGMVAGLMATISMAMGSGNQEAQWKVRALKGWMSEKKIPKTFQQRLSEHCNELWTNRSAFDIEELFRDVPPTMRLNLAYFLYGTHVSNIPLFRDLGEAVIAAICSVVHPTYVLRGQEVITEGQPGSEFYMLMKGELEVSKGNQDGATTRLGFLTGGSFFGESAILSDDASQQRTRTVIAVTDSELCYITREEIFELGAVYPELEARLKRFMTAGKPRLAGKGMNQTQVKAIREYAKTFNGMVQSVRAYEKDRQTEFCHADDTIHVGRVPSFYPPHKESMTEKMIQDRFSEFGEVLTAVIRYRQPEAGKPQNSWALVTFKDNETVQRLMKGKSQVLVPAMCPREGSGEGMVKAKDANRCGWDHVIRKIDPEQALVSGGSFGAIWLTCRQRVMGGSSERVSVGESLRAQADELRQKDDVQDGREIDPAINNVGPGRTEEELDSSAHMEMMGLLPNNNHGYGGAPPVLEEQTAPVINEVEEGNSAGGASAQVQAQMQMQMNELLGLLLSMNNRMQKQDANLKAVRRTVEFAAKQSKASHGKR